MKFFILLFMLILLSGCSSTQKVYWCGDHPCINNKEKEAYFKKTMTVEVREITQKKDKNITELDKIKKKAGIQDDIYKIKKISKKDLKNEKQLLKEKKKIAKETILNREKKLKEEKKLAKKIEREKKRKIKKDKKILKKKISKSKKIAVNTGLIDVKTSNDEFNDLLEKIKKRNKTKPFPNINDIPN